MPKHVTIMRRWTHPQIFITLDDTEINVSMKLDDFLAAVKQQIGSVRWTFKDTTFESQFDSAVNTVIGAMKKETAKVVA